MLKCTLSSPSELRTIDGIGMMVVKTTVGELGIMNDHLPVEAKLVDFSTARFTLADGSCLRLRLGYSSFLKFEKNEALILSAGFDGSSD